jgi:hypothetical protein
VAARVRFVAEVEKILRGLPEVGPLFPYHTERNYQGLGNEIIQPEFAEFPDSGTIRSRQRLGVLLRYY